MNIEKKYYVIANALKLTNGSPFAQQIVHDLYNKGYLVDPSNSSEEDELTQTKTKLDIALQTMSEEQKRHYYWRVA